ncbi:MAG: NGG1p interacting factor NIF3 [Endomicrobiia bacterium]
MKLIEFYNFITNFGIKNDLRPEQEIKLLLKKEKEKYDKLSDKEKKYYDIEKLTNPYKDTRILYGKPETEIKNILVGIDMEVPEILLAETLIKRGKKIDLVLAHHPEGKAYANFYEVMGLQSDVLNKFGVPINIAENILEPRIKEVSRRVMPVNHNRAVDAAKLLDIPFMNCHTPADNCVATYLQKMFDTKKPKYLDEIIDLLLTIPEYDHAAKFGNGPVILVGNPSRRAGKIFVDMTGGTEGSVEMFDKLAIAGVSTVVCMHLSEEHYKQVEKSKLNAIIAGHISSDNLGLNLLFDAVEKKFGPINFIETSGFKRFKRNK